MTIRIYKQKRNNIFHHYFILMYGLKSLNEYIMNLILVINNLSIIHFIIRYDIFI